MASVDEVTQLLRNAAKALHEAGTPDHLQPVAFGKAFDALAGVPRVDTSDHKAGKTSTSNDDERDGGGAGDTSTPLGKIAAALKIDVEDVADVFDIDGQELHLTIRRDQLAQDRREALTQVALLVVAGRQLAALDVDRTHTKLVREQGVQLGLVQKNTFRDDMGRLGNIVTAKTTGQTRELKITRHGQNQAGDLIKRLTGTTGD